MKATPKTPQARTIREMHATWAAMTQPTYATPIQKQEVERAFYAGFTQAMSWYMKLSTDLPFKEMVRQINDRAHEAQSYFGTLGQAAPDISRS